jgi:uncharacterized phage protein gp47/JayE
MAEAWQDFYDLGKATLQTRRPKLVVEEGDVSDAIIAGASSMATALVAYANRKFRATFLDGAEEADLTERARDRGVERDPGAESVGRVTLTRASASLGAGTIVAGTRMATESDETGAFVTFTLDNDVVFGGADLTKTDVPATCSVVGKTGNVGEHTVVRFVDSIFDPSITPNNPDRFAGGVEQESDEELRDRVRGFFLTQARGTIDALDFGARQVPGVDRVSITVDGSGVVTVYVADAQGNSSPALVAKVADELESWRDAADIVYVTGGVIVNQAISISITVRTGVDINAMLTTIRDAIISRVGRLNPGEVLYRDMISGAIRDVDREAIQGVEVITPAANVAPTANQLIRTNAGIITFV